MHSVFLTFLLIGAVVLIAQIVLALAGIGHGDVDVSHAHAGGEIGHGLELLGVRSMSAACVVFGAAGIWLNTTLPAALAAVIAIVPAFGAAWFSAWATRQMTRFDTSGTLNLDNAIGRNARVTLTIRKDGGFGLVQVPIQGRTVELRAIAREASDIPEGATVVVVSVGEDGKTVEVVPASIIEEI
ncbi:MAG: hypothetical protein ACREL7_13380 [Longimicrobiales bacterium]